MAKPNKNSYIVLATVGTGGPNEDLEKIIRKNMVCKNQWNDCKVCGLPFVAKKNSKAAVCPECRPRGTNRGGII